MITVVFFFFIKFCLFLRHTCLLKSGYPTYWASQRCPRSRAVVPHLTLFVPLSDCVFCVVRRIYLCGSSCFVRFSGRAVRAQIELLDVSFSQQERFFSRADGLYHVWLPGENLCNIFKCTYSKFFLIALFLFAFTFNTVFKS